MTQPSEPPPTPSELVVRAYGWPEIDTATDLVDLVATTPDLRDGDVVVITSKVVSKAEGQSSTADRATVIERDTRRIVARRGPSVIAETQHGLVMAAAGVDASNVADGTVLSLPADPDATARDLREGLLQRTGANVAVIITDTAGRAWRNGQTDLAIGCAGIEPMLDLIGQQDAGGNLLAVTVAATADEVAAAADLVKGKATGRPLAVVRGLSAAVLQPGEHGPGARALIRPPSADLFGLGARDAVEAAIHRRDGGALRHFPQRIDGDPEPFRDLNQDGAIDDHHVQVSVEPLAPGGRQSGWLVEIAVNTAAEDPASWIVAGRLAERADALAAAHRLTAASAPERHSEVTGWRVVVRVAWIDA